MGTCYYLIRQDTRTGYDLGKAWEWSDNGVFGCEVPVTITADGAGDLAARLDRYSAGWKKDDFDAAKYFRDVAEDIVHWSEGKEFILVSEHHRLVEEYNMEGWSRKGRDRERQWVTGSRFSNEMDVLRARRVSEPLFKSGYVWEGEE